MRLRKNLLKKNLFREFVLLCKELELIRGEEVAVDGALK